MPNKTYISKGKGGWEMDKVRKDLENMFGRELTKDEVIVLRMAYAKGEQDESDRLVKRMQFRQQK